LHTDMKTKSYNKSIMTPQRYQNDP
jgi:hypothetical protein